ncbi:hypothetical protein TRFO_24137 [Tritrichomonas foetus]|uniref:Glycosyltransferase 61 catalytic domain-containing protein n=1 Tax=Tritrichomonas foetus TaxID=1144522 RepID=A0A1J4K9Q2_9EUKA|nr:hypothetical protein TRFO_24137 [Tritrichomonas foetus]|eukprot:OHT07640.1 hypothetical protein TRFO_24137 [Tritrichomonas foetus]
MIKVQNSSKFKIHRNRQIFPALTQRQRHALIVSVMVFTCIVNHFLSKILYDFYFLDQTVNEFRNGENLIKDEHSKQQINKESETSQDIDHPIHNIYSTNFDVNPVKFIIEFSEEFTEKFLNKLSIVFFSDIVRITFQNDDLNITRINSTTISSYFIIPITSYYQVSFLWSRKTIKTIFYNITNIDVVPSDVSSLECFGRYDHRWCRAKNICWQNKRFIFFGLKNAKINRTSMIPGSRPIPHDYPKCRVVVQYKMFDMKYTDFHSSHRIKNRSFLTCRWYSMEYLWHALFDYTLPLYWTTKLNGGSNRTGDRIFTIDENTSKKGYQFLDPFTNHYIENIKLNMSFYNNTCFDHAIIGFPKSEYNVTYERWKESSLLLPYEYPIEAYQGFREKMISHYINPSYCESFCEPNVKEPRVVIAFRNSTMRDIVNQEELTKSLQKICPHCIIDPYIYGGESFGEQMARYCNASILLSIHGSQLSHMIWMKIADPKKPTAVIEIKPYKYDCRDWYKQIADGAGIKYYEWMNPYRKNTKTGRVLSRGFDPNKYESCVKGELSCLDCHDYLRDQPTVVDMQSFLPIFKQALKYVSTPLSSSS